ncbi:MAG TPA: LLM class flavin-dependent oxidoreductase, partial [Sneathiellales bacterium]|nr:LLM class flavin-dependent oxidoreductase [Sneathiellales bacterium]
RKIGFVNPELGLINIDDPIPLHISAFGPKMRKMTAELNAGWINFVSAVPGAQTDITTMNETRKAAGLDPAACKTMGLTLGCELRNGEAYDSPRAKAQAGPAVAMIIHNMVEMSERGDLGITTDNDFGEAVAAYRRFYDSYEPKDARYLALHSGHLLFLKPEEEPLITGDMIRDLTFTATAPELRERIRALQDMGYTQFTVQVVEGQEDALDDWAGVIEGL